LMPDQKRPEGVLVSVRENSGRVIGKYTTTEDVKFCDLGIMPVTVTVGLDTCNQVIVKDIPLRWDDEYALTVTYNPEPCFSRRPLNLYPICEELLRISNEAGNWIENALIQFDASRFKEQKTDKSGRAFLTMKVGERIEGTISANGYQSKPFSLSCFRLEPFHEEIIQLEKRNGSGL
jgi:hypothetical protein